MKIVFSKEAKNRILNYKKALAHYPISTNRKLQKIQDMQLALRKLCTNYTLYPICMFKQLGQIFDAQNHPIIQNLKIFTYKDKSKKSWSFSFMIDEKQDRIIIYKMKYSSFITETFHYNHYATVNESVLYRIIIKTINQLIRKQMI
jgi:hypothetical protein